MVETGFGDLLRRYRVAAGLTQEELAERSGLSTRGISDLERGARGLPRKDTLQLLLEALDLSGDDRARLVAASRRSPSPAPDRGPPSGSLVLPVPPTVFIGREEEVRFVSGLLRDPAIRLLTLTGPGGTGKTRLALAVAEELGAEFTDGVTFVPLGPLTDPGLVPTAIAEALGLRDGGGRALSEFLQQALGPKEVLLLLDNFEHLLAGSPLVADILAAAPRIKVLVTSRAPLRLRAEYEYAVPPLALPHRHPPTAPEQLAQFDSVRLFIERARAVKADFAVDNETAPAVAEICYRLDGLPLAIELAAARVRLLPPLALLARLERRLPLLRGGPRDLPDRQRTLRDAIAWSHDLLPPAEQVLFSRLAVFVGGFTLEAADVVANPGTELGIDTLEGLEALVEGSLVRQEGDTSGEPRFGMLETIREYALEQLDTSGEAASLIVRHTAFYLDVAANAVQGLWTWQLNDSLRQIERERHNLRSALERTSEQEIILHGLQFVLTVLR